MADKTKIAYDFLINHLSNDNNSIHIKELMNAILTTKEQQELANRVLIFAMLQQGKSQREIKEALKVGIATVSRGAKTYQNLNINQLLPNLMENILKNKG